MKRLEIYEGINAPNKNHLWLKGNELKKFSSNGWENINKSGEQIINYNNLENKPNINNVELSGNKTLDDLGIASKENVLLKTKQTLTDEEKAQAQTNIGVKDTVDAVGVGEKANIQLTVWKENTVRSSRNGYIGTDNNYKISNTIKINRGDKISINLFGTSRVSIVSEVLNNDIHTYIRTILNGIASTDEQFFIADKDMWIEICCSNGTFSNGVYITKIGITNNYLPIPNGGYMRNLFIAAGAVYNEETGFYELNGLTDITESEMASIYSFGKYNGSDLKSRYASSNIRTNLRDNTDNGYLLNNINMDYIFRGCISLEVAHLKDDRGTTTFKVDSMSGAFVNCYKLKTILGVINAVGLKKISNAFLNCKELQNVLIYNLKISTEFAQSLLINYDSIKYLVDNAANTEPITVTVHPTTYSYLTGTAEPTEQVGGTSAEWQAIVTTATEKQISFASA